MSRLYQESHMLEQLTQTVKTLQASTSELMRKSGLHEERLKKLELANTDLAKKNTDLETRIKANEHNSSTRLLNSHLVSSNPNALLTSLHDVGTNRPIRHFPKHEKDIKTMSPMEVIQVLQALGVATLGMGAAEKKAELRVQCGLSREVAKE